MRGFSPYSTPVNELAVKVEKWRSALTHSITTRNTKIDNMVGTRVRSTGIDIMAAKNLGTCRSVSNPDTLGQASINKMSSFHT